MNTTNAIKALEIAKTSAQSAQKAAAAALEAISKFYTVMGDDTWNDLRSAWKSREDIDVFRRLQIYRYKDKDGTEKVCIGQAKKNPEWSIGLTKDESISLAHELLKQWRITID